MEINTLEKIINSLYFMNLHNVLSLVFEYLCFEVINADEQIFRNYTSTLVTISSKINITKNFLKILKNIDVDASNFENILYTKNSLINIFYPEKCTFYNVFFKNINCEKKKYDCCRFDKCLFYKCVYLDQHFCNIRFYNVDFNEVVLKNCDFYHCVLENCNFYHCNFNSTKFIESVISKCAFNICDSENSTEIPTRVSFILDQCSLSDVTMKNCYFNKIELISSNIDTLTATETDLTDSFFTATSITMSSFRLCILSDIDSSYCSWMKCHFLNSAMTNFHFHDSFTVDNKFEICNMKNSHFCKITRSFERSVLKSCIFKKCNLLQILNGNSDIFDCKLEDCEGDLGTFIANISDSESD